MKNYVPENTPTNRNRFWRFGDIALGLVLVVTVGLLVMRNWGVPSEKELLAIEQQVEIVKLQQAQSSLEYDLGVQKQETRGLINTTDALQNSVEEIEQQADK